MTILYQIDSLIGRMFFSSTSLLNATIAFILTTKGFDDSLIKILLLINIAKNISIHLFSLNSVYIDFINFIIFPVLFLCYSQVVQDDIPVHCFFFHIVVHLETKCDVRLSSLLTWDNFVNWLGWTSLKSAKKWLEENPGTMIMWL